MSDDEAKDGFSLHPQVAYPELLTNIEAVLTDLPKQEARLAHYMLLNTATLSFETGRTLAQKVGTSEVTVSRLLRRLGYEGMRGLKSKLRASHGPSNGLGDTPAGAVNLAGHLSNVLEAEIAALSNVFAQTEEPKWTKIQDAVRKATTVYITGFQTVRGISEDFARRLALARPDVRFLSAHDGMLAEWLGQENAGPVAQGECLILIDVVPYAREAPRLCEISCNQGRNLVVVTDELCHWAREKTELVVNAPSRSGLFLESTVGLAAALNLIVHATSEHNPRAARQRLEHWQTLSRKVRLF